VLEYHQLADIYLTDEDLVLYWGKKLFLTVNGNSGPTALSIGAGGSIIQHIERDENNPRIWDVANSKILNIQIIDSTTFRSLTGLEPPKTPITAQICKQLGLPFYSLWRNERKKDGIADTWDGLIGVAEVASKNKKSLQQDPTALSESSAKWGLLKTGAWGLLESDEENLEGEGGVEEEGVFKEQSFEFPIVLLDVDDTLPKFRSVAEPEDLDEVWETMEDEDDLYNE
jgi:hypothetical protein